MTHVGQKAAFELRDFAQFRGAVVELGIECDDSAIGFGEFLGQILNLSKTFAQFGLQRIALLRNSLEFLPSVVSASVLAIKARLALSRATRTVASSRPRLASRYKYRGDHSSIGPRQSRIVTQFPAIIQTIRMHNQQVAILPFIVELLQLAERDSDDSVVRDSNDGLLPVSALTRLPAIFPTPA